MMKKFASLVCIVAFAITLLHANAQNPTPSPTRQQGVEPADEDSVVRITTNLVQIDAVVTDKKGRVVRDLGPDDFEIIANGKPQKITNFSLVTVDPSAANETAPPANPAVKGQPPLPPVRIRRSDVKRTIALVVDDLNLSFTSIYYVKEALKKFVDKQMLPGDLVSIVRTGTSLGTLQQFTSDKGRLFSTIENLKYNQIVGRIGAFTPMGSEEIARVRDPKPGGETGIVEGEDYEKLRDDILSAGSLGAIKYVTEGMRGLPGRKALMLLSEGFTLNQPGHPEYSFRVQDAVRRLIDSANRAGVAIYPMDPRGLVTTGLTAADDVNMNPTATTIYGQTTLNGAQIVAIERGRRTQLFDTQGGLDFLAEESGGFATYNSNDLSGGIRKALDDQSNYYLIGYQPDASTFDGRGNKYNELKVRVKRPGLEVRFRSGFLGITDENLRPSPRTPEQKVFQALVSPFAAGDVTLRFTPIFTNDQKMGSYLRCLVHISAKDLTFTPKSDGQREAVLNVAAVMFGDNGVNVNGAGETHTVTLTEKQYAAVLRSGFVYSLTVPVKKAGGYQLRVAVRDAKSEKIGSATQFVTIPDIKKGKLSLSGIGLSGVEVRPVRDKSKTATDAREVQAGGDLLTQAARRQFRNGQALQYATVVYNAKLDKENRKPNLSSHIELFRDGVRIFSGIEQPYDASKQADLSRLVLEGALELHGLKEGDYVLQIVVRDVADKGHSRVATNWVDFEIVGPVATREAGESSHSQ